MRSSMLTESTASSRTRGVTLVELLVVLVILGLSFALAAPSFLTPHAAPADRLQGVIDGARRLAVQRSGAVTLSLESEDRWVIEDAGFDRPPLLAGVLAGAHVPSLVLHISPLGACTVDAPLERQFSLTVDPVRCRVIRSSVQ